MYLGDAKRQHSVVYFHITLNKTSRQLQTCLVLQEQEVSAAAWFDDNLVKIAVGQRHSYDMKERKSNPSADTAVTKTFVIYKVKPNSGGVCELAEWPTDGLMARIKEDGGSETADVERLSSGTIFALKEWLREKVQSNTASE